MRLAMATLLLLPAIAAAQANKDDEADKVSNDQPGRPLQMPPASSEVKEAFDDFERFGRRSAWERALKALQAIPDDQAVRFLDGEKGFIIPVARKRRAALSALSPEGQAAYRLFYDAEAKKLLDEAEGPSELRNLERVYSGFFISSVGDNAADRLGDLYFEMGRYDRAADCWLSILKERPDTDLSPGLISVKAALALSRAGRRAEFAQVRAELADRHNDEKVTLGGQTAAPVDLLGRLLGDGPGARDVVKAASSAADDPGPDVAAEVDPSWQVRFAESVEAGMTPQELTQWGSNSLAAIVPAVAIDGSTLFANYLGYVFAVDLTTGKMLWRSSPFHQLKVVGMQDQARYMDTSRFAIAASGGRVWDLGRDLKDPNMMAPFRLTCRRAEGGEVVWQSGDLAEYSAYDLIGEPLLAGGKLFIAAKTQMQPQQEAVLAIQPHDGKILWKTEVGTFRQQEQYYYYYARTQEAKPRLLYRAGAVYVDTHVGVLARLDADTGALDWGYGYRTDAVQGQSRFFFFGYNQNQEAETASGTPIEAGEALLIKGAKSDRLYAVDPDRMKVLWERPIAKSSRLIGSGAGSIYLGGPEVGALELGSRKLSWATRLPGGSESGTLLVRPDGLWQLTPRGVFEMDPKTGAVRRIFRGKDLGAAGGGDLLLSGPLLLTVSNRTISAYPRRGAGAVAPARDEEPASPKKRASDE